MNLSAAEKLVSMARLADETDVSESTGEES
jgi:hypothetical protein